MLLSSLANIVTNVVSGRNKLSNQSFRTTYWTSATNDTNRFCQIFTCVPLLLERKQVPKDHVEEVCLKQGVTKTLYQENDMGKKFIELKSIRDKRSSMLVSSHYPKQIPGEVVCQQEKIHIGISRRLMNI